MKFDMDLATGTVKGEFTIDEAQEILAALKLAQETREGHPPAEPRRNVFVLPVQSESDPDVRYLVRIWLDAQGGEHGSCTCAHHKFRGAYCKHLRAAAIVRNRRLADLS